MGIPFMRIVYFPNQMLHQRTLVEEFSVNIADFHAMLNTSIIHNCVDGIAKSTLMTGCVAHDYHYVPFHEGGVLFKIDEILQSLSSQPEP